MLEIFIMLGVIGWFSRTAKSEGKSGLLWGFIGAISYYGPVIIFGRFIYPALVKGSVTYENQGTYMIVGILLNLAIGIGCCFLARNILLSVLEETAVNNNSVPGITEEVKTDSDNKIGPSV